MHVGDAGVRASGAVDAEVVAELAPAHRADRIEGEPLRLLGRHLAGLGALAVGREDLRCDVHQVAHLHAALLDDGAAQDRDLGTRDDDQRGGQYRDDQRKPLIDGDRFFIGARLILRRSEGPEPAPPVAYHREIKENGIHAIRECAYRLVPRTRRSHTLPGKSGCELRVQKAAL